MKKQILIAFIAAAAAAPFAAQAQSSYAGSYVGVNVGRAEQKVTVNGVGSDKDSDTGFKLYGGMLFDKTFGAELGYADLGEAKTSIGGNSVTAKTKALYLAGTATYPLNPQFSIDGKIGVSANRVKTNGTAAGGTSDNRASLLLGVGATYNFAPNLAAVLEYEHFGRVMKEDIGRVRADLVSVGIRYKF